MARKRTTPTNDSSLPTWDERLINTLLPWRIEIGGGLLFLLAMVIFFGLPGWGNAGWLDWLAKIFRQVFGWGSYVLVLSLAFGGLHIATRQWQRPYHITTTQVIGFELLLITALPLSHIITAATLPDAYLGKGGGLFGWALSEPLLEFFGPLLTGLLYLAFGLWGVALITQYSWEDLLNGLNSVSLKSRLWAQRIAPVEKEQEISGPVVTPRPNLNKSPDPDQLMIINDTAVAATILPQQRDSRLPPLTLLQEGHAIAMSPDEIDANKRIIEQTLSDFHLPAEVTEIRRGPAITQFGVTPGYIESIDSDGVIKQKKVRIGQISSLKKDLALALATPRLRIQAPIPGRGVVGIEVPNAEVNIVRLRAIIESAAFSKIKSPLGVALGRDVSGSPIAIDLAKMPHLLIAGTTGSGKSVCINAFVTCLIVNNSPENLRLIMIDPKKVEFIRFNGVPHLIGKVETEADRAVGVLRWLTAEMDRRYETFTQVGARNLEGYNDKVRHKKDGKTLPYIAVFIDELADLMHTYPGDVERTLCRLAQMARATGIHMAVATQRPSTDVITGLIKANFPARLSFAVASNTDSRVILDTTGADQLLGKGDMLFLGPDASAPARIQGVFVNDLETERVVSHWQKAMPDFASASPPWENLIAKHALLDETDSLLEQAIELAQKYDTLSTSLMQRRLRIGFPRAARIMEHLYEMGLVEDPKTGGKTRKTYVEEDDNPIQDYLAQQDE